MRKQESKFIRPVLVRENVGVTSESHQHQYAKWLEVQTAAPRFCDKHPRSRLVLGESPRETDLFARMLGAGEMKPAPDHYYFQAAFYCPACRCALALCPPEFVETDFKTFDVSTKERAAALVKARDFVSQVNRHGCGFALFVGKPGTGKTRLACNIIGELESHTGLYIRLAELIAALRATYGRDRCEYDDEGEIIVPETPLEISQRARFLVLDEIGCTAPANDERMFLDELLKHRYERRKPTILISNLPLDQFKEFLGHALADRIHQATGSGKFILQFDGESFRRTAGEAYLEARG